MPMSNKDNLVIQPGGEIISQIVLRPDVIVFDEEKRQKVIQILRQVPAILDVAIKLSERKTYKVIIAPEVLARIKFGSARLDQRDNGLLGPLIRDVESGQIIHHVSLREVTPDLLRSLNELATQQTLADIVRRLEIIDKKITDVLQGQLNDRLAEIESGIQIYEQAIFASDPDLRRELIVSAIQKLNDGRRKLIKSTDFSFIDKLPRNRLGMFFSRNWDIPKYVLLKAESAGEAARAIVEASRYLVLAYSTLNEPGSLQVSLEQVTSEVKVIQSKMVEIVHWLPPESNWHECLTTITQVVLPNIHDLDDIPQKTIVVEFQPEEILPPEGV